jgi:hypothetical protein
VISIDLDIKALARELDGVKEKQVPFAAMTMLNALGLDVQRDEREQLRRDGFTLRRPEWADRSIKITHFAKKLEQWTTIAIAPPGGRGDILGKFETDTEKRARDAHQVAVPIGARRNRKDIIVKKDRPKAFHFQQQGNRTVGSDGTFIVTLKDGRRLILQRKQRTGTRRLHLGAKLKPMPVKALYLLVDLVELRHSLRFVPTAERMVQQSFMKRWDEAAAVALRTAR